MPWRFMPGGVPAALSPGRPRPSAASRSYDPARPTPGSRNAHEPASLRGRALVLLLGRSPLARRRAAKHGALDRRERARKGDAPLYFQVHIDSVAHAWRCGRCHARRAGPDPSRRGPSRRAEGADGRAQGVPRGARERRWGSQAKDGREEDGHSRARLLIDATPEARWLNVQWAMAVASAPQLKITT